MKKACLLLLILGLLVTVASAEVFNIANPLGAGRWGFTWNVYQDTNSDNTAPGPNGKHVGMWSYNLARGLTDRLDIAWNYQSGENDGSSSVILKSLGMSFKYALTKESYKLLFGNDVDANTGDRIGSRSSYDSYGSEDYYDNDDNFVDNSKAKNFAPFSSSLILGYNAISAHLISAGNINGGQVFGGLEISKIMAPTIPYAAVIGRSTAYSSALNYSQLDLTVGLVTALGYGSGIFSEYTQQFVHSNSGASYSAGQIGIGLGLIFF